MTRARCGLVRVSCLCLAWAFGLPAPLAAQGRDVQPPAEVIAAWGPDSFVNAQFGRDRRRQDAVRIGSDYMLHADDEARDVVVVGADATIEGHASDLVVVLGKTRIASTAEIDGTLTIVGGSATVESGARVGGDLVVVGAMFSAPADFAAQGSHVVIDYGMWGGRFRGVFAWVARGLLWGRPIVPNLAWVWAAVGVFFLVYFLLNLVFDEPVRITAGVLAERPLSAFVVGLLVLLLMGPVSVLLAVSIIGLAVVPLVLCAILVAWIVGKVAGVRWLGTSLVRSSFPESRAHVIAAFVVGFAMISLLYMVPVLGFVTWTMMGVFGLGASTLAFFAEYRRENPAPIPRGPVAAPPTPIVPPLREAAMTDSDANTFVLDHATSVAAPVAASDLTSFPHAWFRDRVAAGVLDLILVIFAWQLLERIARGNTLFLLLLAYHIAFWTWKGTTVGGIICQLRVVRVDGSPLRFVDALVRGLSEIFSLLVVGLGFFWILRDPERQAWHDRIAGTYVVKVPRNWPI
jgi:RDD family